MSDIEFIDCNCMIGRSIAPPFFGAKDTLQIKSILVGCGIKRALVYHSLSVEYHPVEGNMKLIEETQDDSFFIPTWVVMPYYTGEFLKTDQLKYELLKNSIKAVRLSPAADSLNYSISEWSMGEIYDLAQKQQLPVIIDSSQISWDAIFALLKSRPDLDIILTKVGYRAARYLYPIMDKCNNLYVDISMYKNHMGIEHLCKSFGSGRLLYGSAMPLFSPGCAKAMVLNADISIEDKINIASANILRLIGE